MTVMIKTKQGPKEYKTVAERVLAAHADEGYSMLSEETFEIGGREYVRITIEAKGKHYIGSAEIHWQADPNMPEGKSPFETAETSALGRALGFASYGVIDSIASAEEVVSAVSRQPAPAPTNGNSQRMNALFVKGREAGKWANPASMLERISEVLETEVTQANVGQLDDALLDLVEADIDGKRF